MFFGGFFSGGGGSGGNNEDDDNPFRNFFSHLESLTEQEGDENQDTENQSNQNQSNQNQNSENNQTRINSENNPTRNNGVNNPTINNNENNQSRNSRSSNGLPNFPFFPSFLSGIGGIGGGSVPVLNIIRTSRSRQIFPNNDQRTNNTSNTNNVNNENTQESSDRPIPTESRSFSFHFGGSGGMPPFFRNISQGQPGGSGINIGGGNIGNDSFMSGLLGMLLNESDFINRTLLNQKPPDHPTDKNTIDTLPKFKFTKERLNRLERCKESCVCPICLENFNEEELCCLLICQHLYHDECVKKWIAKQNTCRMYILYLNFLFETSAVCRFELPLSNKKEEELRKKRMIDKFSVNGLKIMELGSKVESIFYKVDQESMSLTPKDKLPVLRESGSQLLAITLQLDSFQDMNIGKTRDDRKLLIKKIQVIQKMIDDQVKKITKG